MKAIHSLLQRQVKRYLGSETGDDEKLNGFLSAISDAYNDYDEDRNMLERSLEISSKELVQTNSDLRAIFEAIPDLLFRVNYQKNILDYKAGTDTKLKFLKVIVGNNLSEILPVDSYSVLNESIEKVKNTHKRVHAEFCTNIDEQTVYYEARLLPLLQDEILIILRDITDRKFMEEQLRYQAFHDKLTGLPNRALFMDRLEQKLALMKRQKDYRCAVLFLDLDRFKVLNDSQGHLAGDELLIQIAKRLKSLTREIDMVSRLGGDEFTILVEDVRGVKQVIKVAERTQKALAEPFIINDEKIHTSASIGIAIADSAYKNSSDLLRDADIAMYRAKENGKACHEIFDIKMHVQAQQLLQLETNLHSAINNNQFVLYYQPVIDLTRDNVIGFEALIRWQTSNGSVISPDEFIPFAEESGLIIPIGCWLVEEACRQLSEWQKQSPIENITMNINLSGKQFEDDALIGEIWKAIKKYDIDPQDLKFELTETIIIKNSDHILKKLSELKALGVKLIMDDFGTGYSSLSYLHEFPLDGLKIDQSFINSIGSKGENIEIVRAIISMAKHLGLSVVAEGVETEEQLEHLRRLNCDFAQGYYFSKPVSVEEAGQFVQSNWPFSFVKKTDNNFIPDRI